METAQELVVVHGVSWDDYEARVHAKGDKATPRISYLDGELEVMSPTLEHERIKSNLGALLELYALERGIELSSAGSWTLKDKLRKAGAEPDECYILGPYEGRRRPDLAIEVVRRATGIDKLEIYRRLGVPEVWFWIRGAIEIHVATGNGWQRTPRSAALADLDLVLLCSFLDRASTTQAMREFRAALHD